MHAAKIRAAASPLMILDPFPEADARPTVLHVRTHALSDSKAPFIRRTILGLRPWFRNVVLTPELDCEVPDDVHVECVPLRSMRDAIERVYLVANLRERYGEIAAVVGHMGNGTRVGAPLAVALGAPLLGIFGGSDVNVELEKPTYRDAYGALMRIPSARFLTVADYLRQKLIRFGAVPERLFTWHRGVNVAHVQVAAHADRAAGEPVQAVTAGRLIEVKGHEYLVRAIAALRKRGCDVIANLLGDGPLQPQLQSLAQKLGVADLVRFHGHVSNAEVMEHLRRADLYVHPSVTCSEGRIEGVPNAIMEAHAAGLPVVASDSGGIGEVVLHDRTGFLARERDPESLADGIGALARDGELRRRMGTAGRKHITAEFSLPTQSRRLAAHITHTIQGARMFELRGWNMHWQQSQSHDEAEPIDYSAQIMRSVSKARYDSTIPIIGPAISFLRRIGWIVLVRPYLRVFANELGRVFCEARPKTGNARSDEAPRANGQVLQPFLPDVVPEGPRMCDVACADCPHCPSSAPWPLLACPLDAQCHATLAAEFTARAAAARESLLGDAVTVDAADFNGQLPQKDGSLPRVVVRAPHGYADFVPLLREVARVLTADGVVALELTEPARRSASPVPFASTLFTAEVLQQCGIDLTPPEPAAVQSQHLEGALLHAGLTPRHSLHRRRHLEPCAIDFQARFSLALRRLRASKAEATVHGPVVLERTRRVKPAPAPGAANR
ncbi:MAG: glycosyltransferase [Planctomycetota bacterium]